MRTVIGVRGKFFVETGFSESRGGHGRLLLAGITFLLCALLATPGVADAASKTVAASDQGAATAAKSGADQGLTKAEREKARMALLAKESSNPLGSLWMLWCQNDYTRYTGDLLDDTKLGNSFKFQPVMAFPFHVKNDTWNFIVRPVLQYQSVFVTKDASSLFGMDSGAIAADPDLSAIAQDPIGRTTGLGDTVLLALAGPARMDGLIWGIGASQIFPTAAHGVLGQGKFQAGPAALLVHMGKGVGDFNIGALAQQWFSYAGDDDRSSTSSANIQYFINYHLTETALIGCTPNILINWKENAKNAVTFPIGLGYSNVYKIGRLPIRIVAEVDYSVISPDKVGSDWNFRVMFIPIIPNPFARKHAP